MTNIMDCHVKNWDLHNSLKQLRLLFSQSYSIWLFKIVSLFDKIFFPILFLISTLMFLSLCLRLASGFNLSLAISFFRWFIFLLITVGVFIESFVLFLVQAVSGAIRFENFNSIQLIRCKKVYWICPNKVLHFSTNMYQPRHNYWMLWWLHKLLEYNVMTSSY